MLMMIISSAVMQSEEDSKSHRGQTKMDMLCWSLKMNEIQVAVCPISNM